MLEFISYIFALVVVVTIHEFSHAFVAQKLGDPTAKLAGRVSLNPMAHLDLLGTLMLFLVRIGWGKPVPVNPHYFRHPKRDSALTALAGPLSNLLLAALLTIPLKYYALVMPEFLFRFIFAIFDVSLTLFVFNMLPFPPLDGSKFIGIFVPNRLQTAYQNYLQNGMFYFAVFILFDQFVLARVFQVSILQYVLGNLTLLLRAALFLGT